MKKSKELNNMHNDLILQFDNIELTIINYKKKIKKEYQEMLIKEKNKLLSNIAEGENLNINDLKKKYLKSKEITLTDEVSHPVTYDNEELLDKVIIAGEIYYFENKDKGKVFDTSNTEVGVFKNGLILFHSGIDKNDKI